MKNIKFYICPHCGNIVEMVNDAGVKPFCCGQKMNELVPGSVDASKEKHVPDVKVHEDVVEVTCNVSKNGIEPVKQASVPAMCELYIRLIKHYERLTVEAVREGSEDKAVEALMTHPLINSYSLAKKLIADYNEAYGEKILGGNA